MIEVQALKEKGHYKSFHIQGHAGYADAGEDIVCSSRIRTGDQYH